MSFLQQQHPLVTRTNHRELPAPPHPAPACPSTPYLTFAPPARTHAGLSSSLSQRGPRTTVSQTTAVAAVHRDVSSRFGQRLRQLRVARNLTQVSMAREFGLDRSYISDVERGRKSASLRTMEIFALGLKVTLAELLAGV